MRLERRELVLSLTIHVVLIALFPLLLADFGRRVGADREKKTEIVFYRPPERPPEPLPVPVPEPERPRATPVPERPKPATTPRPKPTPAPRPAPPREEPVEVARVEPPIVRELPPAPVPEKPRPQVKVAGFGETAPRATPRPAPEREIRTAGFGLTGDAAPAAAAPALRGSARVGNFEIPSASGGARGAPTGRGRVEATGFDVPSGGEPAPAPRKTGGSVSTGRFGDDVVRAQAPARRDAPPAPKADTPVEILSKPKPIYTTEARERRVEGEVVLEVEFGAEGRLRVLRVVQGLGFGLDEAAADAAKQITFEPARREGAPVDHTAMLRIVFQLA